MYKKLNIGDIRETKESGMKIRIDKIEKGVVLYSTLDPIAAGFRVAWTRIEHIRNTTKPSAAIA